MTLTLAEDVAQMWAKPRRKSIVRTVVRNGEVTRAFQEKSALLSAKRL
jgi:hypothetical protein